MKNIILSILKGEMPFKMHKIKKISREKIFKKKICVPTIPKIFRPVIPKTHFFIWLNKFITLSFLS